MANQHHDPSHDERSSFSDGYIGRWLFYFLGSVALIYALLAGLRTLCEYDLGWQLATGRWIVQHHQIPYTDVLSYTGNGASWSYPIGSQLIFYGIHLIGGYPLLSWIGAIACVATTALTIRRGSAVTTAIALLAVPRFAARTSPRADLFTLVLFAAFFTILWEQHETGKARLWLLPVLMAAWVNLHLGFVSGFALIAGYLLVEALELPRPGQRNYALLRVRHSLPWLLATLFASLLNPWGWGVYSRLTGFMMPMGSAAGQPQMIAEWAASKLDWTTAMFGLSVHNPDTFILLLIVVAAAVPLAVLQKQLGAAALLSGAAYLAIRHVRFQALFSVVAVIVAGTVLTSSFGVIGRRIQDARVRSMLAISVCVLVSVLTLVWTVDLITDRTHMAGTDLSSFGTGLSWWFPEGAAAFIEREHIPGQVFNSYNEGGFVAWRLGPKHLDYIDGRGGPFSEDLMQRESVLMGSLPDSPEWQQEAERYDINTIIVALGRFDGVQLFPVLRQFCSNDVWKPVYLDEVSAVFVRRRPETASLIEREQVDCSTALLPAVAPKDSSSRAFNQWANAAALLKQLGRNSEAFDATSRAISIFPGSAYVHFTRADLLEQSGNLRESEQEFARSAQLEPHAVSWARLARLYEREGRLAEAVPAWEHVADLSSAPYVALLSIGFDEIGQHHPQKALEAFDRAASSVQSQPISGEDSRLLNANIERGRAMAWAAKGDVIRAILFAEKAVRLSPENPENWLSLADLYSASGRVEDARRSRERAAEVANH